MQLSLFSQRWQERRESYRRSASRFIPDSTRLQNGRRPRSERVHPDTPYGTSYPSARVPFGLFTEGPGGRAVSSWF
jgi:hypothetical protein